MSFGCYGCRDATDVRGGEALIGFPSRLLGPITDHLEYLAERPCRSPERRGHFRDWRKRRDKGKGDAEKK